MKNMKVLSIEELMQKIGKPVWVEKKEGEGTVCFCEVVYDVGGLAFCGDGGFLALGSVVRNHAFLPMEQMNVAWRPWDEEPTDQARALAPWAKAMDPAIQAKIDFARVALRLMLHKEAEEADQEAEAQAADEAAEDRLNQKHLAYYSWYKNGMNDMLHRLEAIHGDMEAEENGTMDKIRCEVVAALIEQATGDMEQMKLETLETLLESQDEARDM